MGAASRVAGLPTHLIPLPPLFRCSADSRDRAALALAFDLPRPKASRASQVDGAEEAPLFERSELGGRAPSIEKRREPIRRSRIGRRQAKGFWFLLASKGTRARSARNALRVMLAQEGAHKVDSVQISLGRCDACRHAHSAESPLAVPPYRTTGRFDSMVPGALRLPRPLATTGKFRPDG